MRRTTFRGSPAQVRSNRRWWAITMLNTACMLTFTGLMMWFGWIIIDHLS